MKVLVINAGSSSLKYQLLNMENEAVMASGIVERIGESVGSITHKILPDQENGKKLVLEQEIRDHKAGMLLAVNLITDAECGVIAEAREIDAVGHRVVQGGEAFKSSMVINEAVKEAIKANNPLAPLHNPANLVGIEVAEELFAGTPNIAVFDTEFHQSMPEKAFLYPIPYEDYEKLRVRRYGFHGTSHKYVAKRAAEIMEKDASDFNVITLHLGNGCSMAAVKNGVCVDTSMGMTPLSGVMMGTRSGDIDPAIISYIAGQTGKSIEEIDTMLNKESGLKGICGLNDMRDIHDHIAQGNERAKLALDMFNYRIKKYIGAYTAVLGRIDAVVFTAGIGENDEFVRAGVCENLEGLGIEFDNEKNPGRFGEPTPLHKEESKVAVWVIPTNEELQIARESIEVLDAR